MKKKNGRFHTEPFEFSSSVFFFFFISRLAQYISPFPCFVLFPSVVSENNKKQWPQTIFHTCTHTHTDLPCICSLPDLEGFLIL